MIRLSKRIKYIFRRLSGKSMDIEQSWISAPRSLGEEEAFHSWFDRVGSMDEVVSRGARDWNYSFAPYIEKYRIKCDSVCEIGFGGGRLLLQASQKFEKIYGIDIHESFAPVRRFLESQSIQTFVLLKCENKSEIPESSLDFIFSFIVIQHFASFEVFADYVDFIESRLHENGICVLYYAKLRGIDGDYLEIPPEIFRPRECSLYIRNEFMERFLEPRFKILEHELDLPRDPVTGTGKSGQSVIVFRRKSQ